VGKLKTRSGYVFTYLKGGKPKAFFHILLNTGGGELKNTEEEGIRQDKHRTEVLPRDPAPKA